MAKFGFNYQVDASNAENQGGDFEIMPEMNAVLEASACDLRPTKDERGTEAALTFEVVEPEEFKGRKIWAYWIIDHADGEANKRFFKYGKPMFDRFCTSIEYVPDPEEADTDDLLFKSFVAKVGISEGGPKDGGGRYADKNEIKKFFFPSEPDKYPEIGVIAGGSTGRPAANDDTPAARPAARAAAPAAKPAAAAGAKPWAKKAAA